MESVEHEADHGSVGECFVGFGEAFVVAAEAALSHRHTTNAANPTTISKHLLIPICVWKRDFDWGVEDWIVNVIT